MLLLKDDDEDGSGGDSGYGLVVKQYQFDLNVDSLTLISKYDF